MSAFLKPLRQAGERVPVRLLAWCLMPNHFHLVLWPPKDGQLSDYMMWLLTAYVRRCHQHYHSSGNIWQGRFKAFAIQEDDHILTVLRYVERNPLRAGLVGRVEDWPWSSAAASCADGPVLDAGPVRLPGDWLTHVNLPQTEAEVERLRECLRRGRPYGDAAWTLRTAKHFGIEAGLGPRGRPPKAATESPLLFDNQDNP